MHVIPYTTDKNNAAHSTEIEMRKMSTFIREHTFPHVSQATFRSTCAGVCCISSSLALLSMVALIELILVPGWQQLPIGLFRSRLGRRNTRNMKEKMDNKVHPSPR